MPQLRFENLPVKTKRKLSVFKKSQHHTEPFIMDVYVNELRLVFKVAGGVGLCIYAELKFLKGLEGDNYFVVSNMMLEEKYGISRQRKYIAIKKLKAEGLIDYKKKSGANLALRLLAKGDK